MDRMLSDNELPLCHSEAVALAEFVSGLVDDRELGVVTRQDRLAFLKLYSSGSTPTAGKLLINSRSIVRDVLG